jgi:5-methylcytosine-specific restriction endonuclease McrA
MAKPVGIGSLFPKSSHDEFMGVTRSRYSGMVERLKRKKLPEIPFTLEEFRQDILGVMGGKEDAPIQCGYCKKYCTLSEVAVDHATPLSRGGSAGLCNLDYPCHACNNRKGSMSVEEFTKLLAFLETIPLARTDVLKRLEQSVALAAGARSNAGTIGDLKKSGVWSQAQAARRAKKKAKQSGLGPF